MPRKAHLKREDVLAVQLEVALAGGHLWGMAKGEGAAVTPR